MSLPTPPQGAADRSSSSLIRILLIASLALNMFFLGAGVVVISRFVLGHGAPPMGVRALGEFPGPGLMLRALPSDERSRIEEAIKPERAQMRDAMMAARKARREAFEALQAQPFSLEVYNQKLDAARTADIAAVTAAHMVIARASALLSPEGRAAVVKAMHDRKGMMGFERRPDHPSPDDGAPPDGPPPDGGPPPAPQNP